MSLLKHMCPKCDYYMPLQRISDEAADLEFIRKCRNCGHQQQEEPGLVMEMTVQEKISDSYKVVLNEFTRKDPRLPHVKNLKCPNSDCPSRQPGGPESDVIYIKYDTPNLMFIYLCNNCTTQWKSR
jgi:DNA-directed RNA polymerase subunit M/transcription elongation factor TFIIS